MSGLYNALFGWNPACVLLAPMLTDENPQTFFPRFRDCYLSEDKDHIEIYTRVGGGNREDYAKEIERLQSMPTYVSDEDDDFDCTYATFTFGVPEEWRADGNIEYKRLTDIRCSRDYHEGDIVSMSLSVTPKVYADTVCVTVEREQVTNQHASTYTPKMLVEWEKTYTFQEFRESPFYDMCIDAWTSGCSPSWDTSLMDKHEVGDNDTSWWIGAHVYEHAETWYGGSIKTGRIDHVGIDLDEDGQIGLSITHDGVRDDFFDGDIWTLRDMIREHGEMTEKLKKLKEHGIDLDGGTLSMRLWEE